VLEGMPCGYVPSIACPDTGGVSASLKGTRLTANCDVVPDAGRVRLLAVPVADAAGDAVRLLVASPKELGISVDTGIDPSSSVGRLDVQDHEVSDALILEGDPRAAVPLAWIAASAELVGVASELLDRAVEHARERSQFGRAIGSFQAIKHRLVDTLVWIERARSLTRYAALADRDDREDRVAAAHDAKAAASEAAEIAARAAVQIHGGLGITEEDDVSLLYLRARQLSMVLGGADAHYACGCRQATAVTAD
jgi:alkylation response protein AidB-like acyl-CoA dehydrogenase